MNKTLTQKINLLPNLPGCYIYKNNLDEIIYVGKAKKLNNRVKSYFTGTHNKKTQSLVSNIFDLEYIIVNSEKEALILENNLIKKYKPYYNIKLKDDKSYPYLAITKEKHPRLIFTRNYKQKTKNTYFGPYVDSKSANKLKRMLEKLYPLRKCNPVEKRPCMYYQIGECIGPCAKKLTINDYNQNIKMIKSLLSGNIEDIIKDIKIKIDYHVKKLEFEIAKNLYDYIQAIETSVQKQSINSNNFKDKDYIGYSYNDNYICIQIFLSRMGNIIERKIQYFDLYTKYEDILYSYLIQYYNVNKKPKEIYIQGFETEILSEILETKVITPQKGNNKKILETIENNAKYYLENNLKVEEEKEEKLKNTLKNIAKKLHIDKLISIDAFDNSNIMGRDPVSVKVNFLNGIKNTSGYRKYKIKNVKRIDDISTTKEVLYRAYKDKKNICDLVIIDGGKNHVKAAIEILKTNLNIDTKIIGLAKNEKHITEYIVTDDFEIINIEKNSQEYLFLKKIQDEVHRFAISYHKKIRTNNMFESSLDKIKGIGKVRKKILFEEFNSLEEIKNCSLEKLQKLGLNKTIIKELKDKL